MRRWLIPAGLATALLVTAGALAANTLVSRITYENVELAEVQRYALCATLTRYQLDNGHLPTEEQGLQALTQAPSVLPLPVSYPPQGYVKPTDLLDPWGNPYLYQVSADGIANVLSSNAAVGTDPCTIVGDLAEAE